MAAAFGWPEHLVTGFAQNAAQLGKDGFPTALCEFYQDVLDPQLLEVAAKTLGASITELELTWPPVEMRDRQSRVSELTQLSKERIISRAQVCRTLNYDFARNQRELEQELQAELKAGPTGQTEGFGGLGMPGAFQMPAQFPMPGEAAAEVPAVPEGAQLTLPSAMTMGAAIPPDSFAGKLKAMNAQSDMGFGAEVITEEIPELKIVGAGADYGFAAEGAMVIGGITTNGDVAVVGEATFRKVPSAQWADVLDNAKAKYPGLKDVYTGSDEPELTAALNERGYQAVIKHIGESRVRELMKGSGRKILIHYTCTELLSDLFPEAADKIAGMHTAGGDDHKDAHRYLFIGLLEAEGQIGAI